MKQLKTARSASAFLAIALAFVAAPAAAQTTDGSGTATPDGSSAPSTAPSTDATASSDAAPAEEEATTPPPATTTSAPAPDASTATTTSESASSDSASSASSDDEDTEDEAAAIQRQAQRDPLAWRNSFFSWSHGLTFNSLLQDAQQTYNPTYYHYLFLQPRWYVDASTFFVLTLAGFQELTDDDTAVYDHEFQFSDISVDLRRTIPWEGFIIIPSARLSFPASKGSQAAQRITNTGLGVTVVRAFPEVAGMTIAANVGYRRWWTSSTVPIFGGQQYATPPSPASMPSVGGPAEAGALASGAQTGSATTESDRVSTSLTLNLTPVQGLTVTLQGAWIFINQYDTGTTGVPATGATSDNVPVGDGSPQGHWDPFTSYSLTVAYDFIDWLNVSIGYSNSTFVAPFYNDDGSVRSPFNPDSQLSLSATVTLDTFYQSVIHGAEEEEDGLTPEERQRRRQGLARRSSPTTAF